MMLSTLCFELSHQQLDNLQICTCNEIYFQENDSVWYWYDKDMPYSTHDL